MRRTGWRNVVTFVLSLVMVLQNLLSPVQLAFADDTADDAVAVQSDSGSGKVKATITVKTQVDGSAPSSGTYEYELKRGDYNSQGVTVPMPSETKVKSENGGDATWTIEYDAGKNDNTGTSYGYEVVCNSNPDGVSKKTEKISVDVVIYQSQSKSPKVTYLEYPHANNNDTYGANRNTFNFTSGTASAKQEVKVKTTLNGSQDALTDDMAFTYVLYAHPTNNTNGPLPEGATEVKNAAGQTYNGIKMTTTGKNEASFGDFANLSYPNASTEYCYVVQCTERPSGATQGDFLMLVYVHVDSNKKVDGIKYWHNESEGKVESYAYNHKYSKPVSAGITIKSTVNDAGVSDGIKFTYNIKKLEGTGTKAKIVGNALDSVTTSGSDTATFNNITYGASDINITYYYIVYYKYDETKTAPEYKDFSLHTDEFNSQNLTGWKDADRYFLVKVDVGKDNDGNPKVDSIKYNDDDAYNSNWSSSSWDSDNAWDYTYTKPATASLQVKNRVNEDAGAAIDESIGFEYSLSPLNDKAKGHMPVASEGVTVSGDVATLTAKGNAAASFGDIAFTEEGNYDYIIYYKKDSSTNSGYKDHTDVIEADPDKYAGWEDDGIYFLARVSVTESDGALKAEVRYDQGSTVSNGFGRGRWAEVGTDNYYWDYSYTKPTEPVKKSIQVKTTANGNADNVPSTAKFTYALKALSTNAPMPASADGNGYAYATTTGGEVANFDAISFTKAGTYDYAVFDGYSTKLEDQAANQGLDWEDDSLYILVRVIVKETEDAEGNTVLDASYLKYDHDHSYSQGFCEDGGADTNEDPSWDFSYTSPATGKIQVKTTVNGSADGVPSTASFTYALKALSSDAPMPEGTASGVAYATTTGASLTDFGSITYTEEGTYNYAVYDGYSTKLEDQAEKQGLDWEDDTLYFLVQVKVEEEDGNLKVASVKYDNESSYSQGFGRSRWYNAATPDQNAWDYEYMAPDSTVINVKSTLNGKDEVPDSQQFTYRLAAVTSGAPMPAGTDGGVATTHTTGSEVADFGLITYSETGTYDYVVYYQKQGTSYIDHGEDSGEGADTLPEGYTDNGPTYYLVRVQVGYSDDLQGYKVTGVLYDQESSLSQGFNGDRDADPTATDYAWDYEYTAPTDPATYSIAMQSTVNGEAKVPSDVKFRYKLTAQSANAPLPENSTVTTTGSVKTAFDAISFSKAGTYDYRIDAVDLNADYESNQIEGWDDDTLYMFVRIKVVEKDGKLEVESCKYDDDSSATTGFRDRWASDFDPWEFEYEAVNDAEPELQIVKTVNGKSSWDGDWKFSFYVYQQYANGNFSDESDDFYLADGTNTATYKLSFDEAGTYTYWVAENEDDVEGMDYASDVKATITVTDDYRGNLVPTVKYSTADGKELSAASFNNTYTAPVAPTPGTATAKIAVKSVVSTDDGDTYTDSVPSDVEFSYNLAPLNDDSTPMPTGATGGVATTKTKGSVPSDFGTITYTKAGTYDYIVYYKKDGSNYTKHSDEFESNSLSNWSDDEVYFLVRVTVTGSDDDLAVQSIQYDHNSRYTQGFRYNSDDGLSNTWPYEYDGYANAATQQLNIAATLNGKSAWSNDQISFNYDVYQQTTDVFGNATLTKVSTDATETAAANPGTISGSSGSAGKTTFASSIEPGANTFIVREQHSVRLRGMGYDADKKVVVTAEDDFKGGVKITGITYYDGTGDDAQVVYQCGTGLENAGAATFNNTYNVEAASLNLAVESSVSGPVRSDQQERTRTFQLQDENGNVIQNGLTVKPGETAEFAAVKFQASENYNPAGVHTYKIVETTPAETGWTNADPITATVNVELVSDQNGANAEYVARVVYSQANDNGTAAMAAASYKPLPVNARLSVINVKKTVQGENAPEGAAFKFELYQVNAETGERTKVDVPELSLKSGETGSFAGIAYEEAGEYSYVIHENVATAAGWTYSQDLNVVVTVSDNAGQLEAKADQSEYVAVNSFKAAKAVVSVEHKLSEGSDAPKVGQQYTYVLLGSDDKTPAPEAGQVTIDGNGNADFSALSFNTPGTYTYYIHETTDADGVTPADDVKVTIVVGEDPEKNELTTTITYAPANDDGTAGASTNTFTAAKTDLQIPTNPDTDGSSPSTSGLVYSLTPQGNAPAPEHSTATPDENGNLDFGEIEFNEAGEYFYTLEEAGNLPAGWQGSDPVTVKVTVGEDPETGEFKVMDVEYMDANGDPIDTGDGNGPVDNKFTPAKVTLGLVNTVEGDEPAASQSFTFTAAPLDENDPAIAQSVTLNGAGEASFDEVALTTVGAHVYTIHEERQDLATGWAYIKDVKATVVVAADENNALYVKSVTYDTEGKMEDGAAAAAITNTFTAAKVPVKVSTRVSGDDPAEGTKLTYALKDSDGNAVEGISDITLGVGETKAFDDLVFNTVTAEDGVAYTIHDATEGVNGWTNAPDSTATVTVTRDPETNQFVTKVVYSKANAEGDAAEATSTYDVPKAAKPQIKVTPGVSGSGADADHKFTYGLYDEDGNKVADVDDVSVKAGGVGVLDGLELTKEGTYTYTIRQTGGTGDGYAQAEDITATVVVKYNKEKNAYEVASITYSKSKDNKNEAGYSEVKYTKPASGDKNGSGTGTGTGRGTTSGGSGYTSGSGSRSGSGTSGSGTSGSGNGTGSGSKTSGSLAKTGDANNNLLTAGIALLGTALLGGGYALNRRQRNKR